MNKKSGNGRTGFGQASGGHDGIKGLITGPQWNHLACRLITCVIMMLPFLLATGCSRGNGASPAKRNNQQGQQTIQRDLARDESRGGHTLNRHVGRTDVELQERLRREPNIGAASTYTDRATAEEAVGATIAANQERISRWTERSGRHPNLVLDYTASQPVGRTLHRGDSQAQACSRVLAVLKFDGHGEYHVLTSYPECR